MVEVEGKGQGEEPWKEAWDLGWASDARQTIGLTLRDLLCPEVLTTMARRLRMGL